MRFNGLRVAVDFYPRVRSADAVQKRAHLRNLTKAGFNELLPGKKNSKTKVAILTSNKIGKTYMHTLCGKEDMDVIVTTEQTD